MSQKELPLRSRIESIVQSSLCIFESGIILDRDVKEVTGEIMDAIAEQPEGVCPTCGSERLSPEASARLLDLLENPPEPNEKLKELFRKHGRAEQPECEACLPAPEMSRHANDVIDRLRDMKNRVTGMDVTTAREGEELISELLHRCGLHTIQAEDSIPQKVWATAVDNVAKHIVLTEEVSLQRDWAAMDESLRDEYRAEALSLMLGAAIV